jgi:glycosyltransferase involved in cell wall biosynthesis
MKLTYVLGDYPVASEVFVTREIEALRALGVDIQVLTTRSGASHAVPPVHDPVRVDRPLSPRRGRFWLTVAVVALQRPLKSSGLIALACSLGLREGRRGPFRALRLALVTLYFAHVLRRSPPQIFHAHFASAPTTLALLLARWFGCPFGFSVHASDLYAEPVNLVAKIGRACHVFACSRVAAEDVRRRLPCHLVARVHAIHHGIERASYAPRDSARGRDGEALVLAVGRFEPKKGFDVLVEACAILRDKGLPFRCEIIGAGREERALRDCIDRHGLRGRVALIPWQSQRDLLAYYARADVLAVPSVVVTNGDRDNIPNVILEGLANDVPVVASDLPALVDVLRPASAAIVVPSGDASALAEGLHAICNDRDLADELRIRGRQLLTKQFDLQANARRLLDQLRKSVPASPGPV